MMAARLSTGVYLSNTEIEMNRLMIAGLMHMAKNLVMKIQTISMSNRYSTSRMLSTIQFLGRHLEQPGQCMEVDSNSIIIKACMVKDKTRRRRQHPKLRRRSQNRCSGLQLNTSNLV